MSKASADSPIMEGFPYPQYQEIHRYSLYGMV